MHWFDYVWIVPVVIGLLIWAFFSVRDIIMTIRDYIDDKEAGHKCNLLTYMDVYLEEYTKGFIATIVVVLMVSSFVNFLWDIIPVE